MYGEARGSPATAQLPATCTKRIIAQQFAAVHCAQSCTFLRGLLDSFTPTKPKPLSSNACGQILMHAEYSQCHLHCTCMYTSDETQPAASLLPRDLTLPLMQRCVEITFCLGHVLLLKALV